MAGLADPACGMEDAEPWVLGGLDKGTAISWVLQVTALPPEWSCEASWLPRATGTHPTCHGKMFLLHASLQALSPKGCPRTRPGVGLRVIQNFRWLWGHVGRISTRVPCYLCSVPRHLVTVCLTDLHFLQSCLYTQTHRTTLCWNRLLCLFSGEEVVESCARAVAGNSHLYSSDNNVREWYLKR